MTETRVEAKFRTTSNITTKQKDDINFAILEYLTKYKYDASIVAFKEEAKVSEEYNQNATISDKLKYDLERKWTSIARLKKQVMDLERQLKQSKEINEQYQIDMQSMEKEYAENGHIQKKEINGGDNDIKIAKSTGDAIPREPQKLKLVGHRARVTRVIFHPIYTQIATSSEDASIKIWDYETGECESTLREHTGMVNYICFNPQGDGMASCARDMTIKLWKQNKEQEFKCFKTLQGHEHEVSCVEYLKPTGDFLISCSRDQTVRIWDSNSGFLLQTLHQHSEWVRRICQTSDGGMIASASKDETVIVWNMEKIKQNLNNTMGFDPSDFIISVIDDHEHVIDCIKFAPELACRTIQKADYNKGGNNHNDTNDIMEESTGDNSQMVMDETQGSMMKEDSRIDEDSRISEQKRMTTKEKVLKLKEDLKKRKALLRGEVSELEKEEEQKQEVEEPKQEEADIQIDTSKQEKELEKGSVNDYIATGSRDKKIRIFDVKSGRCVVILAGHDNWITDINFHPNGKYLISTADDKSIRVWDISIGRCYRKIYNAHDHFISCYDMKGKYAATGSVDTSVKVWQCR